MGFFDRFSSKKPDPTPAPKGAAPSDPTPSAGSSAAVNPPTPAIGVKPRLTEAREKLDGKDLPGAMAVYEEILAGPAGDRADVLVAISGDLGSHGHVGEIIELIAPRYDAARHGPATGLNLLQAYLAVRNADAAQHVLDILFTLNRPELEDRLHGFSNAIAEILASPQQVSAGGAVPGAPGEGPKIGLITFSKPIWFYGLEPMAAQILPPKEGRLRRIAFAQLALPGYVPADKTLPPVDDELTRLARSIPLWFAETFYFSAFYGPVVAIGLRTPSPGEGANHHVVFNSEWTTENFRQLVDTTEGGLDYIVSGALKATAGDYELVLRIWEVKAFRERKAFHVRWTPSTADAALTQIHTQLRTYMEWSPASAAFAYTVPTQPRAWLDLLAASAGLFLVEKTLLPREQVGSIETDLQHAAPRAATSEAAALAYLTMRARATKLGFSAPVPQLARSPLVNEAQKVLGTP